MDELLQSYLEKSESSASNSDDKSSNQSEANSIGEKTDQVDATQKSEVGEKSLEDQLAEFEKTDEPKSENPQSLIDEISKLGIIRNGLPVDFKDVEQVKEVLSKGFDYTQKTQELAEQRKSFETEIQTKQQEIELIRNEAQNFLEQNQEKITENEIMASVLAEIKAQDSEVFDFIANAFNQKMQMISFQKNNPALQGLNKELSEIKKTLAEKNKAETQEKFQHIQADWEKGLSEVQQSRANTLRKLGIKPNWTKVQEVWKSDASGKMTVDQAFLATHGTDLTKALDAHKKNLELKIKSANRVGPEKVEQASTQKRVYGNQTYLKDLEEIASKYNY